MWYGMDLITLEKIPIRIDWSIDKSNNYQVEIVMNTSDFFSSGTIIRKQIMQFKKRYIKLIEEAKKLARSKNKRTKNKFQSSDFWKLGKILFDFNKEVENEFFITNYTEAISRDMKGFYLSDTEVGVLGQFVQYFKKNEVFDIISFAHYRDFTWKWNKLSERGLLEQEKQKFLELGKKEKLPDHKKYRNQLKLLIETNELPRMRENLACRRGK